MGFAQRAGWDAWDAAQARQTSQSKAHSHARRDRTPKRPISGLLRCGKCGGGMSIHDRSGPAIRHTSGVINGPAAEQDIAAATAKRKALEARLAEQVEPEVVELHPASLAGHFKTIDALICKRTDLNPRSDRALVETLHIILARGTVFPVTDKGVTIEATGWLQPLSAVVPGHGGIMVAEEGLEPPTRGL